MALRTIVGLLLAVTCLADPLMSDLFNIHEHTCRGRPLNDHVTETIDLVENCMDIMEETQEFKAQSLKDPNPHSELAEHVEERERLRRRRNLLRNANYFWGTTDVQNDDYFPGWTPTDEWLWDRASRGLGVAHNYIMSEDRPPAKPFLACSGKAYRLVTHKFQIDPSARRETKVSDWGTSILPSRRRLITQGAHKQA